MAALPDALTGLPKADALFVGGGDRAVLEAAVRAASPASVVVTLAAVQRVGETSDLLTDLGYRPEGVQLQASRLAPLPNGSLRLAAENPVFVLARRKTMIGLISVTKAGQHRRQAAGRAMAGRQAYDGPASTALPRAFDECDAIVCFLAVGATVRLIAPLLRGKSQRSRDRLRRRGAALRGARPRRAPGGANDLAGRVAQVLGSRAGHHHGQRRGRRRRARRVRRRPGLRTRAGQRPGRRGHRDPVRRAGHLHRRHRMAAAPAPPERRAH